MAERPYVAGAVAIGVVAAALRLGTGGAPAPAPPSSLASQAGRGGHAVISAKNAFNTAKWSTEMNDHPEALGKLTAQKELEEAIGDFYKPPPNATRDDCNTPEVMIAIEPDPAHTHLALLFDRDMDAMEEALQDSGWEYQSNWLPWSASTSSPTANRSIDEEQRRLFLKGREQSPGVILFRRGKAGTAEVSAQTPCDKRTSGERSGYRPLVVFLVGNSPTGGINRPQFEDAVSRLRGITKGQKELRILGPTFTGSGASLQSLLNGEAVSKLGMTRIRIATGSITEPHCEHLLPGGTLKTLGEIEQTPAEQMKAKQGEKANGKGANMPADPKPAESNLAQDDRRVCVSSNLKTTLVSFGGDREWGDAEVRGFLETRGGFTEEQIAELTEDESSYGNRFDKSADQAGKGPDRKEGRLQLYFPRNISHLRSAYQKSNVFGFGASTQGSGSVSLNLDFDEANDDDDSIPSFAGRQMPVSQDGVMHQIADVLEQRHIKVVLLSATDVLDEIFISQLLAREAPNVLVVADQTDNLFLRSSSGNYFSNMYFVSQWPLITDSQLWSRPSGFSQSRTFPSDLSQGLYAAVRYLFEPQNPDLPDYGSPLKEAKRPPLWVSAVGHGDYWPVAVLENTPQPDVTPKLSPFHLPEIDGQGKPAGIFAIEQPPLSQSLLLLLLTLLALYHTAKCFGVRAIYQLSYRYTLDNADSRTPKLRLQLGLTVLLLLAIQLSITPSNINLLSASGWRTNSILLVSTVALCATAAWLIILFFRENPGSVARMVGAILGLGFVFFAYWEWHCLWGWLSEASGSLGTSDFFRYRSSYPLRGVSPVFPLFLAIAGFFVMLYNRLDRFTFTEDFRPHLPDRVAGLPNIPGDGELTTMCSLLMCKPTRATRWSNLILLAMIAGVTAVFMVPLRLLPRMFDGFQIELCLSVAMFVLFVAVLWDAIMAGRIWYGLKSKCLERLESSSLRRGFNSIHGLTWSSLWILRGNSESRYRIINRLLEQAERLVLFEESSCSKDDLSLKEAFQNILDESKKKPYDAQGMVRAFGDLQERIAFVAHLLLVKLERGWFMEARLSGIL